MSTNWSAAKVRVPRFAEVAVERARLVVVPPVPAKAATAPFVILLMAIMVAGVLGILAFNTNMQDKAFETTRLQNEADALLAKEQRLSLELDALRNPQALAQKAKQMGMVPPTAPAFLQLSDGKVLGDRTPAVGGPGIRINPNPAGKPAQLTPKRIVLRVPAAPAPGTGEQLSADTAAQIEQSPTGTGAASQNR
ncbi:MAG TPA: hypothetical protein PKX56_07180 [Marmoricola sp.]|nr:hypothetical protein [Marmoricola sp.]HNI70609.1 hypothetical protein [Marmoricola sp.]HNJ79122.1 hypothetical protein [Marmoricola sp.]HNN48291.1 hypothetical protein [Marmoricola sp.]HNO39384.1 hypothetical protein [Marmoricola sp.]